MSPKQHQQQQQPSTRSTLSDFKITTKLGSGSFGQIFLATRHYDSLQYCLKSIPIGSLTYAEQVSAIGEVKLLARVKSDFVVKYFDSFVGGDVLYIVMEYADRGDLKQLITRRKGKQKASGVGGKEDGMKRKLCWSLVVQMLLGLYDIHKGNVLHRDMKTANVFLTTPLDSSSSRNGGDIKNKYALKIGDLGVAKLLTQSTLFANTIVGTPYYLSPELCEDKPYNTKSDVWAFGVVVYEMCCFAKPFEARNQCALIMKIIKGKYKSISSSSGGDGEEEDGENRLGELVDLCLELDCNKRKSVKELLEVGFVKEMVRRCGFRLPEGVGGRDRDMVENSLKNGDYDNDYVYESEGDEEAKRSENEQQRRNTRTPSPTLNNNTNNNNNYVQSRKTPSPPTIKNKPSQPTPTSNQNRSNTISPPPVKLEIKSIRPPTLHIAPSRAAPPPPTSTSQHVISIPSRTPVKSNVNVNAKSNGGVGVIGNRVRSRNNNGVGVNNGGVGGGGGVSVVARSRHQIHSNSNGGGGGVKKDKDKDKDHVSAGGSGGRGKFSESKYASDDDDDDDEDLWNQNVKQPHPHSHDDDDDQHDYDNHANNHVNNVDEHSASDCHSDQSKVDNDNDTDNNTSDNSNSNSNSNSINQEVLWSISSYDPANPSNPPMTLSSLKISPTPAPVADTDVATNSHLDSDKLDDNVNVDEANKNTSNSTKSTLDRRIHDLFNPPNTANSHDPYHNNNNNSNGRNGYYKNGNRDEPLYEVMIPAFSGSGSEGSDDGYSDSNSDNHENENDYEKEEEEERERDLDVTLACSSYDNNAHSEKEHEHDRITELVTPINASNVNNTNTNLNSKANDNGNSVATKYKAKKMKNAASLAHAVNRAKAECERMVGGGVFEVLKGLFYSTNANTDKQRSEFELEDAQLGMGDESEGEGSEMNRLLKMQEYIISTIGGSVGSAKEVVVNVKRFCALEYSLDHALGEIRGFGEGFRNGNGDKGRGVNGGRGVIGEDDGDGGSVEEERDENNESYESQRTTGDDDDAGDGGDLQRMNEEEEEEEESKYEYESEEFEDDDDEDDDEGDGDQAEKGGRR